MKCMEYANKNHINIIPKENFEELVLEVFNVISDNLSKSLGPLGSSATIFDGSLIEATKDGYSILNKYSFNNRYKKMIYNLIKAPCTKMNNTVGDGTTTAITLTNAIYQEYSKKKDKLDHLYRLPREFTAAWDDVVNNIIEKVKSKATPIDPEDYDTIYNIAYVVSNGNDEVSKAFAKTYHDSKSPAIKMKDSPTNKSYIEAVEGFEFPANAIDPAFVKNEDLSVKEKDIVTMIFDHKVETDEFEKLIVPLNNVYRAMSKKLVIIAADYDDYMLDSVVKGYVNYEAQKYGKLNFSLLQYANGKLSPYQREDLAVVLRSIIITQQLAEGMMNKINEINPDNFVENLEDETFEFYRTIGSASEALITCNNGSIFNVEGIENDKYYQNAIKVATALLDDILAHTDYEKQSFAAKVYDARSRLLQLQMKNYIYYIGADSDLQKQITHDAIEDVIKCLRSAIKYGVVPGCQISIMQNAVNFFIEEEMKDDDARSELKIEIAHIIYDACSEVYKKVLNGPNFDGISKSFNYDADDIDGIMDKTNEIICDSLEASAVFDISTLKFNKNIITSSETDTMVLSAASELIKILISGNQCIFLDSDVTESHQDEVQMYV